MQRVEAFGTQPRSALAAWAISFNLVERFLVVGRVAALDALNAISSQSLSL